MIYNRNMHDLPVLKHFLCVPFALLLLAGCEYFNLPLDEFIETHAAEISVESVTFDTATAGRFLPDSGIYVLEPPSPLTNVTVYINLKNDVNLAFDCTLTGTVNGVDTPGRITPVETGKRRLRVNIANPGNGERYGIRLAIHAETGRLFNISVPPILCSAIIYTVTFDNQGHGASPSPQTLPPLALVSDPGALSENGWIFGGWYKEADCTNPWNFGSDTVSGNITLYARWTPNIGITVINALGSFNDITAPVHDAPAMTPYMPAGVGYSADNFEWTSGLSGGTGGDYVYGTPAVATVTLIADTGYTFTGTAIDAAAIQTVFSSGSPAAAITGAPGATLVFTLTYAVAQAGVPPGSVSITGTPTQGQALTADTTSLGGTGAISYQWQRGASTVPGATGASYPLTLADTYQTISVVVSRAGYTGTKTATTTGNIAQASYAVGDTGPAGGIIFYVESGLYPGATWQYLEAAPADIESSPGNRATLMWASSGYTTTSIPSAQGTAIGTGAANTAAILAADPDAPAAKACADYGNGAAFDDWFLPSEDELYAMRTSGITGTQANPLNGFNTGDTYYWSSPEYNSDIARMYRFMDGSQGTQYKYYTYYVRAVRAF
ncbi:hypothetical protein AGMMS49546_37930 [Spirochaetia bacterium]|nr:hypothetical protein AGMMS49546_37930 [Spirochaetia bacterium]